MHVNSYTFAHPLALGTVSQILGTHTFARRVAASTTTSTATVADGDKGDITVSASGATWTIDAGVVTLAKIANAAANSKLVGSGAAGSGAAYSEITVGSGLTMTGTTLSASGGSGTVTSITLTQPAAGLTITGSGSAITTTGTPTFALANDLAALEALTGTSTIYYRSATDTWTAVTIGSGLSFTSGTLAVGFASQADQEAGSSTVLAVTPGRQQNHPSAAKAWVIFDASSGTPSILASQNVTSITDNGVGQFTVNFNTSFSSTSYVAIGMCTTPGTTNGKITEAAGRTASAFPFACLPDGGGTFDASRISLAFFGDT